MRAFAAHADAMPWAWGPAMLDEWLGDLRGGAGLRRSTIRSYCRGGARVLPVSSTDPAYGWAGDSARSGSAPTRCRSSTSGTPRCTSRTTRRTRASGRSPSTSCRRFFDHADDAGRPGPRRSAARGGCRRSGTRRAVQDGLRLRAAPQRDADARCRRLRPQPARAGVRRVRRVPGPVRQGEEGLAAQAPQRADRVGVGARGPGRVVHRGPAAVAGGRGNRRRCGRPSAARGSAACGCNSRFGAYRGRARPGRGPGFPLAAPLICHPPDRGRLGPAVRPGAGRPRARLHHLDLHLRVLGLPHPHAAAGAGRHRRPPRCGPGQEADGRETARSATSGGCGR